ncbi:hypothetical protein RhiirA4_494292 [Rhizophagus irregularis]|uniref:Uncharacterized protein n=1 Tax=Rhizophagus irregularis TaxID=588596 RepID=A0A2I1GYD2_9GLOM|nr:hypothetical protein RhiirA4_494292 [Rhizophagus irregularis]
MYGKSVFPLSRSSPFSLRLPLGMWDGSVGLGVGWECGCLVWECGYGTGFGVGWVCVGLRGFGSNCDAFFRTPIPFKNVCWLGVWVWVGLGMGWECGFGDYKIRRR